MLATDHLSRSPPTLVREVDVLALTRPPFVVAPTLFEGAVPYCCSTNCSERANEEDNVPVLLRLSWSSAVLEALAAPRRAVRFALRVSEGDERSLALDWAKRSAAGLTPESAALFNEAEN